MKNIKLSAALLAIGAFAIATSCSDDDSNGNVTKAAVIANYADIAYQNYKDAYDDAVELEEAINAFAANPTQATFDAAKAEWKESRESYGTTEAFRFANGPIDDEDGPEDLINSWPLDEAYIDYVQGDTNAGIINNPAQFPTITKASLEALNQTENEESVSVGYHAIEFLLWGQDLTVPSANQPGQRPYTDFVDGGTASNQVRRRQYLVACADLLTDHLQYLVNEWQTGGAYRNTFLALPEATALQNIYLGIVTLASAELAVERMDVALLNMSQEDEHSCFSDNTHRDVRLNLQGIVNIYKGSYASIDGPSLEDLVKKANSTAFNATKAALEDTQTKMNATQIPFDAAISEGPQSTEGAKVKATVTALQNLGATFIAGASAIGVTVNG